MGAHVRRHIVWLGLGLALGGRAGRVVAQARVPQSTRIEQRWAFAADGSVRIVDPSGRIRVIGWDSDSLAVSGRGPGHVAADGNASVRKLVVTGRAELEVHVPRGASVDLGASTLSGTIVVRAAGWQRGGTGVQRGRFESVTGDVRFDGELGRGGIVELESQSGAIALRLPRTTVADFDLLTIGGS